MIQYFLVDNDGEIKRSKLFSGEDEIPKMYKEGWGSTILQEPYWDFKEEKWLEKMDNLDKLNKAKEEKIDQLSLDCTRRILGGFKLETITGIYRISYDKEAQANLSERWQLFQNDIISSIRITAHDHEDKSVRLNLNKVDFNALYIASIQHKEDCISHFRDELIPLVDQALSIEAIQSITWETKVVQPAPSPIVLNDSNTINKQIDMVKMNQAEGSAELISLIMMMGMGGM